VVLLDGEAAGCARWSELPAAVDDAFLDAVERAVSPVDWATVFFTSGTTAEPKAVVHAHGALATAARGIAERLGIGPDDAWWGHLPLFWSGGFVLGALATIAGGGRVVLQEVVDAASALELLEREGCTIMAGWHQAGPLLEHPEFAGRRLRLRKGTRADPELTARLLGPDHHAVGCYGMSETATFVSAARWDDPEPIRLGTFGRPLEGMEIRIEPVAAGERRGIRGLQGSRRGDARGAPGFLRGIPGQLQGSPARLRGRGGRPAAHGERQGGEGGAAPAGGDPCGRNPILSPIFPVFFGRLSPLRMVTPLAGWGWGVRHRAPRGPREEPRITEG